MKRHILTTCFLVIIYSLPWTSSGTGIYVLEGEAKDLLGFFGAIQAMKIAEHNSVVHEECTLEQLKAKLTILMGACSISTGNAKTEKVAENST